MAESDVTVKSLNGEDRLLAFRYHDLILLKNYSDQPVSVRGRPLARGGFCRIYPGQRILVGDQVLTYPGAGHLLQREEKRLASANLRPREQGCR